MTITVNYQKRKNFNLFNKFQTNKNINLEKVQNYIPIYERFFTLNNNNYNSINLNHAWSITDIKDSKNKDDDLEHVFTCKIRHISDKDDTLTTSKSVFIKMAPLLDPFKYLVGKYNHNDSSLFNLPSIDKAHKVHPKVEDPNNSSFIDGFFSFLTSKLLHSHNFIHGLDYYGSFLAIKKDFKIDVFDDIDYLVQSDFFNKQQNILFHIEDYTHLISSSDKSPKMFKPLNIAGSLNARALSAKSLDDTIFESIFENHSDVNVVSLDDIKSSTELVDITNSSVFLIDEQKKSKSLKSESSCSSRTSYTNDNDNDVSDSEANSDDGFEGLTKTSSKHSGSDIEDDESDVEEEALMVTIPQFPVQVICMEKCEDTLDNLIIDEELNEAGWFSALMQIIMILITYQKTFSFTHNDLHTNNIMYVPTNHKFIYYTYKKNTYKVPTYGRLYKIIDFGRAIYKFNGKLFCSDSFQTGGDAATQYNTEPYFNDKKSRLEPNFSFDLCRLACSIFDYVVEDFENIKSLESSSPLVKLIIEWCLDDNGVNVLYKNNGMERYPDFKLYKMIARLVHNHTPTNQLERPEFSKFLIPNKNIPKNELLVNIDDYPTYC
jgi:hypothetical protein